MNADRRLRRHTAKPIPISIGEHKGLIEHVNLNVAAEELPVVECKISGILDSGSKSTGHNELREEGARATTLDFRVWDSWDGGGAGCL
jgi:hypothetical protein